MEHEMNDPTVIERQHPVDYHEAKQSVLDRFEVEWLMMMVKRFGANVSHIARQGDIDRSSVYRLMDKHGLNRRALGSISDL